jgi:hypothetical protein
VAVSDPTRQLWNSREHVKFNLVNLSTSQGNFIFCLLSEQLSIADHFQTPYSLSATSKSSRLQDIVHIKHSPILCPPHLHHVQPRQSLRQPRTATPATTTSFPITTASYTTTTRGSPPVLLTAPHIRAQQRCYESTSTAFWSENAATPRKKPGQRLHFWQCQRRECSGYTSWERGYVSSRKWHVCGISTTAAQLP